MLEFIVGFFEGIYHTLTGILPVSPFQGISFSDAVGTALGWLNWLVPVGDMLGIFSLWLTAAIVAAVANFIVRKATGVVGGVVGGGN